MAFFTNQATLTYNGIVTSSNIVTGTLQNGLTVTKTAVLDTYAVGDSRAFVVSISNPANTAVTALTVTDNLGAYTAEGETIYPLTYEEGSLLAFADGELQPAPTVEVGPPLVITGIEVPANGNVILVYSARVNAFAPPIQGGEIVNCVTLGNQGGVERCRQEPVMACETITAEEEAVLTVSKSLDPDVVSDGDEITFTFVIQNTGNTGAGEGDDVVITDTFELPLSDVVVRLDGEELTQGAQYTYDAATGAFSTVAGVITVPAATFEQQEDGTWTTSPGAATLTVTGTV